MQEEYSGSEWYARRDGVIRGPFTASVVSRYILLGRIRLDDELSENRQDWQLTRTVVTLLPEEIANLSSWSDYQQLVVARLLADERRSDRRAGQDEDGGPGGQERRSGEDRRQEDGAHMIARLAYGRNLDARQERRSRIGGSLLVPVLVVSVSMLALLLLAG